MIFWEGKRNLKNPTHIWDKLVKKVTTSQFILIPSFEDKVLEIKGT